MSELDTDDAADPISNQRPIYPVEVPITALLKVAGVVVVTVLLLAALARAQQLVGLVIAAAILASLLAPLIAVMARGIGRLASTLVVHMILLVVIAVAAGLVVQSVQRESAALEEYTAAQVEDIAGDGGSTFLSRTRLDDRLGDAVETWGVGAVVGDDVGSGAGIAARASQLVLFIIFSIFFTLQAQGLLSMAVSWSADRHRRRLFR